MYLKISILPPGLIKRLLALAYFVYPELLSRVQGYISSPGNVAKIMSESGITALISMLVNESEVSERLTMKGMRSISASILPMLHEHKSYLIIKQSAEVISVMQLGHTAPGPSSN